MAFVLKQPIKGSKGVLMFTHKEIPCINPNYPGMQSTLRALKKQYFFGMHWGFFRKNVKDVPFIDFYLAAKGIIERHKSAKIPQIHLASRNFVPAAFKPNPDVPKFWDILCVAHSGRFKKLDEFLKAMRLVYDKRPETKCLLVCPEVENPSKFSHYTDLIKDYKNLFSEAEREKFTILQVKRKDDLYPIRHEVMAHFYQQSRVFTLFTDVEGHARVISEALLTGLPVVVKSHLQGGGRDFLVDGQNSRQFSTIPEAAEVFIDLLDHSPMQYDVGPLAEEMSETYSVPKLIKSLKEVFKDNNEEFLGNIVEDRLVRRFSAHTEELPRYLTIPFQDDLKSPAAAYIYLRSLLGRKPNLIFLFSAKFLWVIPNIMKRVRKVLRYFKHYFLKT